MRLTVWLKELAPGGERARSGRRVFWALLAGVGILLLLGPVPGSSEQAAHAASPAGRVHFSNSAPGVAYAGSKACALCHPDIYRSFLKTDMGRAMSPPSAMKEFQDLKGPVTIKQPKANRFDEVYRRGQDFYQSEYELDAQGKQVFRDEQKIAYVVGSGANGFTCIVRRGKFMFEAPLSYYSKARAWGLSPGYEARDFSFSRPITADCISCHSGRPHPVAENPGEFHDPPFEELSIGCENCHGPGSLHIKEREAGASLTGPIDTSIVNPEKLPGWLANNICMFCHQALDATALMPGKRYADFRPGTPLADTLAIFAEPFRRDSPPQEPLLQHYTLMRLSRCYLESEGKLKCITCHDPHFEPSAEEAPAYFRSKCLTCHTEASCKIPFETRKGQTPPDNCIGCHMPRQNLQEISHSSLTNHRIIARQDEPLPKAAFHMTSPSLPDLVFLDAIPSTGERPVPLFALLQAYSELMATHSEYEARFDATLDKLAKAGSQEDIVLSDLALKRIGEGSPEAESEAADLLQRAIRAGSTNPRNFEMLGSLQAKAGRQTYAMATLLRGIKLNPYAPGLYRMLAPLYISANDYDDALSIAKKELEIFPEDSYMRRLMKKLQDAQVGNSPPPSHR